MTAVLHIFANGIVGSLTIILAVLILWLVFWKNLSLLGVGKIFVGINFAFNWFLLGPAAWTLGLRWKRQRYRIVHMALSWFALATLALIAPFGIAVAVAVLSFVAIFSAYAAWGESEEELANRVPHQERRFAGDFRDEALGWIVFLFLVAPIAVARMDSVFDILDSSDAPEIVRKFSLDWVAFVLGELVRALPIVDLFEVYGLENPSGVIARAGLGQHVTFLLRVAYDLVIIAGLVRILTIARRQREGRDLRDLVNAVDQGPEERATSEAQAFRPIGASVVTAREELRARTASPDLGILSRTAIVAGLLGAIPITVCRKREQ